MTLGRAAFIGLGVMGYPMAGHLARAGYEMRIHNRSPAKAEQWAGEHGGTRWDTSSLIARLKD